MKSSNLEATPMHDLFIALAYVGILFAPAIVAAFSGKETDA
jgi:hypothetical protein